MIPSHCLVSRTLLLKCLSLRPVAVKIVNNSASRHQDEKKRNKETEKSVLRTSMPSTTHRSPTSNGWTTNTKIIASNKDWKGFPSIKAAADMRRTITSSFINSIKIIQIIITTTTRIQVKTLFSCSMILPMSVKEWDSANRLLKALICHNSCNHNTNTSQENGIQTLKVQYDC